MALKVLQKGDSSIRDLIDGELAGSWLIATDATLFYVSSIIGTATGNGTKDRPLTTIDAAINLCTADKEDTIYVLPNHVESITAATSLVVDVNSINIIGLGTGNNRPQLTFDNTAGKIPISADNVHIENIIFMNSLAAVVTGVEVTGENVEIVNCEWNLDATGLEFLVMLDLDTADYALVEGCKFVAENIAGCNTGIRIDNSPGAAIRDCVMRGDYTTAAISGTAGTAAASVDLEVSDCKIENKDTTAGMLIDMHDDTTGFITDMRGFTLYATNVTTCFDPGDCLCNENYVVNAVNETGIVSPTTAST